MTAPFPHDSFLGGFNIFKRIDGRQVLLRGQRPPYPIIIDQPTTLDVVQNLNRADLGLVFAFFVIGFPLARVAVSGPIVSEFQRRTMFSLSWTAGTAFGGLFALANSYYRLKGLVDNGLRWKRPERKLRKYDFSTEFEDNTIWKHFRLRL